MKFTQFRIQNFKGIDDITINLNKTPDANIFILVGLNESGKTTILEAINTFNPNNKDINALEIPGGVINDFNSMVPISKRDNFNGRVTINTQLALDEEDLVKINKFVYENTQFKKVKPLEVLSYTSHYNFKDSKFETLESFWSGFEGVHKSSETDIYSRISVLNPPDNISLASFCKKLVPSILYFPSFLFDFPSKIMLEYDKNTEAKEEFYVSLIQDILYSLDNDTNIKTHLVDRIKSEDITDKKSLATLLQKMSRKVTEVVFGAWHNIFKREIRNTKVAIDYGIDKNNKTYLEFNIEAENGIYQLNERSLGFRWFFTFLLFTQFRPFRKEAPQNVIYMFDEPASNLHSSAQKQLLKSFSNLTKNSKVIYTTHSHYLIDPHWLESTYVVKNEGLNLDDHEAYNVRDTNIKIEPYRDFASKHPYNTAYFQPILDVLHYTPSNLESLPNCVFLEGKNDFYTLEYFNKVIFDNSVELNLAPSTSSSNMDTLISLYIAWGKNFIVLLDSDKEGKNQKQRYLKEFGAILNNRLFTLEEIDPTWKKHATEKLFNSEESLKFLQSCYPETLIFNKTNFNRAIQESLINQHSFEFSEQTKNNFTKVISFLKSKL